MAEQSANHTVVETDVVETAVDERLAKALEASNYRLTLNVQRENSKLKLKNHLVYSQNGGIFKITQDFISFIFALSQSKKSAVILDSNENPVKIDDLEDFYESILDIYQEGMNDYLIEYEKFKKLRTTAKVVTW
jgi:hypothetical protein